VAALLDAAWPQLPAFEIIATHTFPTIPPSAMNPARRSPTRRSLTLLGTAVLASTAPALRAARVALMASLKAE
jgi:hypothetical protein